jgi:hypothetical protein
MEDPCAIHGTRLLRTDLTILDGLDLLDGDDPDSRVWVFISEHLGSVRRRIGQRPLKSTPPNRLGRRIIEWVEPVI